MTCDKLNINGKKEIYRKRRKRRKKEKTEDDL